MSEVGGLVTESVMFGVEVFRHGRSAANCISTELDLVT